MRLGILNGIVSDIQNFLTNLRNDPADTLISLIILAVCLLFSLIIHECAHGYVALRCGDPTAKMMGRLTLDPRKHLDPIGTVCMVLLHVGWAKPVPVNPRNFKNYKRDYILVSLAGIAVNFVLFLVCLFLYILLFRSVKNHTQVMKYVLDLLSTLAQINLGLAVFNLIPVPPLDGFRVLDHTVFKGKLSLNQNTMQIIHYIFLFACISGLLSGFLGTINGSIWYFFARLFWGIL